MREGREREEGERRKREKGRRGERERRGRDRFKDGRVEGKGNRTVGKK